jgi:hypothetical protein
MSHSLGLHILLTEQLSEAKMSHSLEVYTFYEQSSNAKHYKSYGFLPLVIEKYTHFIHRAAKQS